MTLARAANRAWDRGDVEAFDLIAMSAREEDRAIQQMPTEELEALMAKTAAQPTQRLRA